MGRFPTSLPLLVLVLAVVLPGRTVFACGGSSFEACEQPSSYYSAASAAAASGSGAALKEALHLAVSVGHDPCSYSAAWSALQELDEAPGENNKVQLAYSDVPALKCLSYNNPGYGQSGTCSWNREHLWPRSFGVGDEGPDHSDLHALRPCDEGVNSARSNKKFAMLLNSQGNCNASACQVRNKARYKAGKLLVRLWYSLTQLRSAL